MAIDLTINIPIPPDDLFHKAGYANAARFSHLTDTNETVYIEAPAKLSSENREVLYYPNQQTPLWIIFQYAIEKEEQEDLLEVKFDLTNLFETKK